MRLTGIWRHPVKSFQGEALEATEIDVDGMRADRAWGVRDTTTGRILTARREPRLLFATATVDGELPPLITLPDGTTCTASGSHADAALSAWLDRPVTLSDAATAPPSAAEMFADATDDTSQAVEWTMPPGRFVDVLPLLVLTTASLRTGASAHPSGVWDVRRFRPNLLVDVDEQGWVEDAWCGRVLKVGDVELDVNAPCVRCTMVTRAQPGLDRDLDVYRTLSHEHGATFGVWASVRTPGTVRLGDTVSVLG
jgi:uncharacterized protein YcbX